MREITFILAAVLLMLVLSGCAQQTAPLNPGGQGNTTAPNTNPALANNTQTQTPTTPPVTTPPVSTAYSVDGCSLLTANDIQSVVGIPIKDAVFYREVGRIPRPSGGDECQAPTSREFKDN
ncbi:hypothetical protein COT30_02235, partial [Candidatus Micrarchaeota archaeon CG08_land_8_20_14_0_20_49_17]